MIIGIGGPSNAGKTALAKNIARETDKSDVLILCQDDYVFPEGSLPRFRGHTDWEIPATIDFKRFIKDIETAARQHDVVIAEGFLLYADDVLTGVIDRRIFIRIGEAAFRERKAQDLRWGKEPDWYIDHIWQCYLRYGQAPRDREVLLVDGERPWLLKEIFTFINK